MPGDSPTAAAAAVVGVAQGCRAAEAAFVSALHND